MNHTIRVISETLSDGSRVYNISVGSAVFHMVGKREAYTFAESLLDTITNDSVDTATITDNT